MPSTSTSTRTFMPKPAEPKKAKKPRFMPRFKLDRKVLPWLIVLGLVLISLFLWGQYNQAKHKLQSNTSAVNTKRVSDIVSRVGKLIILPKNETPTIITVKDASKLKGEQFYAEAQNGDITLVYAKQKKAILYRPSQNIIVNEAPVTVTPTNSTQP